VGTRLRKVHLLPKTRRDKGRKLERRLEKRRTRKWRNVHHLVGFIRHRFRVGLLLCAGAYPHVIQNPGQCQRSRKLRKVPRKVHLRVLVRLRPLHPPEPPRNESGSLVMASRFDRPCHGLSLFSLFLSRIGLGRSSERCFPVGSWFLSVDTPLCIFT
jgi:hypothetical protein